MVRIGKNMKKVDPWNEIKRFASWKMNFISIGGILTLVKSVLASFPLYFLSLFKALESIIIQLDYLRRRFFRGQKVKEKQMF